MKKTRARVVNLNTQSFNKQVDIDNPSESQIQKTPQLLKCLESNEWYRQEDIARLAEVLMDRNGYDFKEQFEVIGGEAQLRQFIGKHRNTDIDTKPIFIIYNVNCSHWVTFAITKLQDIVTVLYKDTFGKDISDEIKFTITQYWVETAGTNVLFKSHRGTEQTDSNSCGPMSLINMEKMLKGLKSNKTAFVNNFEKNKFCTQNEVQRFKSELSRSKLTDMILNLGTSEEFRKALGNFIDTCSEYRNISVDTKKYSQMLLEEAEKQEKDPNYEIDCKAIDEARKNFLNHSEIESLKQKLEMKRQENVAYDGQIEQESNILTYQLDIEKKFPYQMWMFTQIFKHLTNIGTGEKHEKVLKLFSEKLGIDYNKIKIFFELQKEVVEIQETKDYVWQPKSIDLIEQELLLKKEVQSTGPDEGKKTLEQLWLELSEDIQLREQYCVVKKFSQNWKDKSLKEIHHWAEMKKGRLKVDELHEAIAVVDRGNELVTGGHHLRDTQIISLLAFLQLKENQGKLCQIHTGEGKTTIISVLSALKVLQDIKVDVITSNQVLAEEGVKSRENFYGLFGISVTTNNPEESYIQGPKQCYAADVVYGYIGNFQFDYLRDSFEGLETRAKRGFGHVILDEVDSMLIDNGGFIAKLAEPFPGVDSLKYALIKIWQELCKADREMYQDAEKIIKENAKDLENEGDMLDVLIQKLIAGIKSKVKASNPANINLIPVHLKQYARDMVDKWIDNAIFAKYQCHKNEQYVIKQKGCEDVIVPVDYQNTGVTLKNTIWSNGLHQFVQLKHNLHLTSESLTCSFISNIGYIKLYNNNIFGLTGTLGSRAEQRLLSKVYNVDYAHIPTYKQKKFKELEGYVIEDKFWVKSVAFDSLILAYCGRSVLIICRTIKDLKELVKNIKVLNKTTDFDQLKIRTYPDEESSGIVNAEVGVSEIIVATNIAGRGTDFKTSLELEVNGGLHVCVSFLPINQRVEEQAFGRTARQGNSGTGQLLIKESDVLELGIEFVPGMSFGAIKEKRDEIEKSRLENVENVELAEVDFQDCMFSKFSDLYRELKKKQMENPSSLYLVKDLKEYWAFWLQRKKFKGKDLTTVQLEEEFANFERDAKGILGNKDGGRFLGGEITRNPYYSILQAEHFLNNDQIDKAEKALYRAINLSEGNAELLYSAYVKLFEVAIEKGGQIRERFKKAVKDVMFVNLFTDVSKDERLKDQAKDALEKAKKALDSEISYLKKHFIGESCTEGKPGEETAVFSGVLDFQNIIITNKKNYLVKHINSRIVALNTFYQHVVSLLEQLNDSSINDSTKGLAISTRVPNYLKKLDPHTEGEKKLREAITDAELSELGLTGLETIYALREVHDVPDIIIWGARTQIGVGLSMLASGVAFPPFMPIVSQIAGTLISEGICDIAIELINQGHSGFNKSAYVKSKCITYAIALATMGIMAIAKSTKLLDKAIKACKDLSVMLRKCPVYKSVCEKLATTVDKLAEYLQRLKHAAEILRKTKQLKVAEKVKKETYIFYQNVEKSCKLRNLEHIILKKIVKRVLYLRGKEQLINLRNHVLMKEDSDGLASDEQVPEKQDSEKQDSEEQDREEQNAKGQGSEGQGSEGEGSEGQGSEGQDSDEQGSDEEDSDIQNSEEQDSEEQGSDEQSSDEQGSDEQVSDKQSTSKQDVNEKTSAKQDCPSLGIYRQKINKLQSKHCEDSIKNKKSGGSYYELNKLYPKRRGKLEIDHFVPNACYVGEFSKIPIDCRPSIMLSYEWHRYVTPTTGNNIISKWIKEILRQYNSDGSNTGFFGSLLLMIRLTLGITYPYVLCGMHYDITPSIIQMLEYCRDGRDSCNRVIRNAPQQLGVPDNCLISADDFNFLLLCIEVIKYEIRRVYSISSYPTPVPFVVELDEDAFKRYSDRQDDIEVTESIRDHKRKKRKQKKNKRKKR